jgi:hypothetical protein
MFYQFPIQRKDFFLSYYNFHAEYRYLINSCPSELIIPLSIRESAVMPEKRTSNSIFSSNI